MDLPRYCLVGDRPVKLVRTGDGGMSCLEFDPETDRFERSFDVFTRVMFPTEPDVYVLLRELSTSLVIARTSDIDFRTSPLDRRNVNHSARRSLRFQTVSCIGAAALWLACPAPGSGPGSETGDAPDGARGAPAAPPDPRADSGDEGQRFNLRDRIREERRRLREVPGRTGILAERRLYSLFDEELIIRDFFQDRRGGFFVDVGCAWPVRANNTYYLEKHLGWTGIGIDALSDYAADWAERRPGSKFHNFLVTDHSESGHPFFKSESPGLSSTRLLRADGSRFGGKLEVERIQVPAITLDDLLERTGVEKVDLLAMDIEGHELEALRGIDLDRFRPELIVVEGSRKPVLEHLERRGYEVIERYRPFDGVNTYLRRATSKR